MSAEKTEAIVIRLADFSETSRVVTLFSRDFGRISALAKGAKRLRGPFESALDLLSTCQIVFLHKSSDGLDLLTEAKLCQRFRPDAKDLTCFYGGSYVAELLNSLTEPYDPHPQTYDVARETLLALEQPALARLGLLRFEVQLLKDTGHLPEFEVCVSCGEELADGRTFGYWIAQGGLICPTCQREGFHQIEIQAGTAAIWRVLANESTSWKTLQLTIQQQKELQRVTSSAISHVLGHRPQTARYLQF